MSPSQYENAAVAWSSIEGEPHDAGDVAIKQAAGHLLSKQEGLGVDSETGHRNGVRGEDASDRATAIAYSDLLFLAIWSSDAFDCRRLAGIEGGRLTAG